MKVAALGAAIAAVLLLSACSSSSDGEDAAPEAAAESSTTSTTVGTTTTTAPVTPEPTEEPAVEETPTPELTPGPSVIDTSNPDEARAWQQTLADLGYSISVDGQWGPGTEEVTSQFQTDRELPVSGVVDQATFDVANFLAPAPVGDAAAPAEGGEAPVEAVDQTATAEEQNARYEQAKTDCTDRHGLLMAGPCVAESMCFDVEPVGAATECRRSYWQLWQNEPGAA